MVFLHLIRGLALYHTLLWYTRQGKSPPEPRWAFEIISTQKGFPSQDVVAKKAGITQAQVARLENSSQIPRPF